jgi:hypothetical protein
MSVGTFSTAYHRALEGLYKLGYYTVSASTNPEAQHLRHPTKGDVWVTELPEHSAIKVEIRRNGYRVDMLVSMCELVCIDNRLLEYIMKVVIMKLEGSLEPLHIPVML